MRRIVVVFLFCGGVLGCGGSGSPTSPTPAATTRIISVSGDLAFGSVAVGSAPTRTFTIANSGNAVLTFTGLNASGGTGTAGFTASPTSGSVAAGSSVTVTVRFTPTVAQSYSTVLTVAADQTSGTNTINVSGTGVNNSPLFTQSGTGNNVIDLPSSVTRLRITGQYSGNSSNFVIWCGSQLVVNELLGTAWNQTSYSGTHQISSPGCAARIENSTGVAWTLTEVR